MVSYWRMGIKMWRKIYLHELSDRHILAILGRKEWCEPHPATYDLREAMLKAVYWEARLRGLDLTGYSEPHIVYTGTINGW